MIQDDKVSEPIELSPEIPGNKPSKNWWKRGLIAFAIFIGFVSTGIFIMSSLFFAIPYGPELAMSRYKGADTLFSAAANGKIDTVRIKKDILALEKKVDKLTGQGPYLIVNTTENKFYMYSGNELIRQGPCSTGSNIKLVTKSKEYKFKTPRGVHRVESKAKNPVWAKPDWAFIEDGIPIPPRGDPSRFDRYTLGDYKLEIGDDYMIHGTLYKRMIGLPVTHGCIRMLDDDIEAVYKTLPIGAKVIIY